MRDWVNPDGTRKIQGEFVKLEGDQLTLKKPDGKEMTFSTSFLREEDKAFALAESQKPKSELPKLIGARGKQAFDVVDFGGNEDATQSALLKSSTVEATAGGSSEFFGQKIESSSEFVVTIDGAKCRLQPVYKGGVLDELHIYGEPFDGSRTDAMRSKWAEIKAILLATFGAPSKEFLFPKLGEMEDNANGMTHSWILKGNRRLDLAIQKTGKSFSVTMRVVAGL